MKMSVVGLASYDVEITLKRLWMIEEDAKEKAGISVKQLCDAERDQQVFPDVLFAFPAITHSC